MSSGNTQGNNACSSNSFSYSLTSSDFVGHQWLTQRSFSSCDSSLIWIIELFETLFWLLDGQLLFSFFINLLKHLLHQFWEVLVKMPQCSKEKKKNVTLWGAVYKHEGGISALTQLTICWPGPNILHTSPATKDARRVGRSHAWLWPLECLVAFDDVGEVLGNRKAPRWHQPCTFLVARHHSAAPELRTSIRIT